VTRGVVTNSEARVLCDESVLMKSILVTVEFHMYPGLSCPSRRSECLRAGPRQAHSSAGPRCHPSLPSRQDSPPISAPPHQAPCPEPHRLLHYLARPASRFAPRRRGRIFAPPPRPTPAVMSRGLRAMLRFAAASRTTSPRRPASPRRLPPGRRPRRTPCSRIAQLQGPARPSRAHLGPSCPLPPLRPFRQDSPCRSAPRAPPSASHRPASPPRTAPAGPLLRPATPR
jgi:hypothetical protein